MNSDDAIRLLGLSSNPTEEDVRQARIRLLKKYHPDRHPGSNEVQLDLLKREFQRVQDAADFLLRSDVSEPDQSGPRPQAESSSVSGARLVETLNAAVKAQSWDRVMVLALELAGIDGYEQLARLYLARGCIGTQQFDLGRDAAKAAATAEPENALAWFFLAVAMAGQQRWHEARDAIFKAIRFADDESKKEYDEVRVAIESSLVASKPIAERVRNVFDDKCQVCGTRGADNWTEGKCRSCGYKMRSAVLADRAFGWVSDKLKEWGDKGRHVDPPERATEDSPATVQPGRHISLAGVVIGVLIFGTLVFLVLFSVDWNTFVSKSATSGARSSPVPLGQPSPSLTPPAPSLPHEDDAQGRGRYATKERPENPQVPMEHVDGAVQTEAMTTMSTIARQVRLNASLSLDKADFYRSISGPLNANSLDKLGLTEDDLKNSFYQARDFSLVIVGNKLTISAGETGSRGHVEPQSFAVPYGQEPEGWQKVYFENSYPPEEATFHRSGADLYCMGYDPEGPEAKVLWVLKNGVATPVLKPNGQLLFPQHSGAYSYIYPVKDGAVLPDMNLDWWALKGGKATPLTQSSGELYHPNGIQLIPGASCPYLTTTDERGAPRLIKVEGSSAIEVAATAGLQKPRFAWIDDRLVVISNRKVMQLVDNKLANLVDASGAPYSLPFADGEMSVAGDYIVYRGRRYCAVLQLKESTLTPVELPDGLECSHLIHCSGRVLVVLRNKDDEPFKIALQQLEGIALEEAQGFKLDPGQQIMGVTDAGGRAFVRLLGKSGWVSWLLNGKGGHKVETPEYPKGVNYSVLAAEPGKPILVLPHAELDSHRLCLITESGQVSEIFREPKKPRYASTLIADSGADGVYLCVPKALGEDQYFFREAD